MHLRLVFLSNTTLPEPFSQKPRWNAGTMENSHDDHEQGDMRRFQDEPPLRLHADCRRPVEPEPEPAA
jgi:hypothetical protein